MRERTCIGYRYPEPEDEVFGLPPSSVVPQARPTPEKRARYRWVRGLAGLFGTRKRP